MTKEIYINTGLYDSNIVILTDNEDLELKLVGKTYSNLTYYLKAKNGSNLHEIKFVDNLVKITRKNLIYGKFKAKIVAMSQDNIVKEFEIEDLLLREVGTTLKVIPEVELFKNKVNDLEEKNTKLTEKINELEKICENTKNLVLKINGLVEKVVE